MTIKMIVAVSSANAIGLADGRLPWKSSTDMKRFKALTTGGTVIMGMTTFRSLNRPNGLPNRKNIVLTRKPYTEVREYVSLADVDIISSLDYVRQVNERHPDETLWIIGGAQVYAEAIKQKLVDEIYLTVVTGPFAADVHLPFELASWKLFVLHRQSLGEFWTLESQEFPEVPDTEPPIAFIHLVKQ